MTAARLAVLSALLAVAACIASVACVTAPSESSFVAVAPDRATFPLVSDLLDRRCGTLDCHGITFRNLRIYGREGLRLAPLDRPTSKPGTTTVAEYDATFQSLVGLEPEIMTAVVTAGGASPERLTFIRKARGTEDHKGLAIWSEGSLEDQCVTLWLAGKLDATICQKAIAVR